jgi:hypothetical protein
LHEGCIHCVHERALRLGVELPLPLTWLQMPLQHLRDTGSATGIMQWAEGVDFSRRIRRARMGAAAAAAAAARTCAATLA